MNLNNGISGISVDKYLKELPVLSCYRNWSKADFRYCLKIMFTQELTVHITQYHSNSYMFLLAKSSYPFLKNVFKVILLKNWCLIVTLSGEYPRNADVASCSRCPSDSPHAPWNASSKFLLWKVDVLLFLTSSCK